ncbi:MAG: hypothetical protein R3B91_09655 [Planctomycetaceae bacterium]
MELLAITPLFVDPMLCILKTLPHLLDSLLAVFESLLLFGKVALKTGESSAAFLKFVCNRLDLRSQHVSLVT